ncbi:ImmA/IrrE family metallo-endopeptidase [Fusobacterium sp.]|uniref:ImmA/IrrE family metallo-endopeptidase n=1 Tax=Fusobacterium sp. TaxID=68766 RepID=UPI0025BC7F87|nr:ImmA/IrrE family metallo-endopeptidase [Fusobacterium sp.]MCI7224507.1 ImmA/IrrE family metallo-endopeptidase [Fusobacterium sp.]
MNIKVRVNNLIEKYGTKNPLKLTKKLKIDVRYCELGNIKGFYKKILKRKYIFINCKLNNFERKLVLAHELGHAILHSSKDFEFMIDHTRLIRRSKVEQEANEFASYLIFGDGEEFEKNHELEYAVCKNINSWIVEDILRMRE